jgi:hypothetical protein
MSECPSVSHTPHKSIYLFHQMNVDPGGPYSLYTPGGSSHSRSDRR